jgi:hypothetical protein
MHGQLDREIEMHSIPAPQLYHIHTPYICNMFMLELDKIQEKMAAMTVEHPDYNHY